MRSLQTNRSSLRLPSSIPPFSAPCEPSLPAEADDRDIVVRLAAHGMLADRSGQALADFHRRRRPCLEGRENPLHAEVNVIGTAGVGDAVGELQDAIARL